MNILVTGAGGLIGSSAVEHFASQDHRVIGIENNSRQLFFGPQGAITNNLQRLQKNFANFENYEIDITEKNKVAQVFAREKIDVVIHCAAQPSHDKAAEFPMVDFNVNAYGTLVLLENFRLFAEKGVFIHMSTNKVYGDGPNHIPMRESELRYDFKPSEYELGINENFSIDNSLHSIFGASKVAADVMAQEYGKYFGLNVGIFRGGCLTGPNHAGVELHGFLSYLVKCVVREKPYTIFGYKGKQVRDQIHNRDVMKAFDFFIEKPRAGEVYNLGGGRLNSASVIECVNLIEKLSGKSLGYTYSDQARRGDHICYYTDMSKFKRDYPGFKIEFSLEQICSEMIEVELSNS